tara:strand:- start:207 stop:410 length:204 start_codon:yes stop_codon:yes gene_type:complete
MRPNDAKLATAWALDEGYKLAVHHYNIHDWSKVKNRDATHEKVVQAQLKIAKIIVSLLSDLEYDDDK